MTILVTGATARSGRHHSPLQTDRRTPVTGFAPSATTASPGRRRPEVLEGSIADCATVEAAIARPMLP
jgi:uncharacterized protein YbjT (DUF2867 family)